MSVKIISSVIQVSVVNSTLFSLFINDLLYYLKYVDQLLCADDSKVSGSYTHLDLILKDFSDIAWLIVTRKLFAFQFK